MSANCSPEPPAARSPKAPETGEAQPEEQDGNSIINIKVKDQNEAETSFKIKKKTKLGKVFDAYCERQSLGRKSVRFLFEGGRIQNDDTPALLEMDDGDMIDAMLEQTGGNDTSGATPPAEAKPSKPEGGEDVPAHINIKVKDHLGQEVTFKIKRTTPLRKVIDAYCQRQEVDRLSVRFLFEGHRIQDADTPISRDMEDEDIIEVFVQQIGGTADEATAPEGAEANPMPGRLTIKVVNDVGDEIEFRCKSSTPLEKLTDAYCSQKDRKPGSLRFFTADGKRITTGATPASLDLEDGDVINAHEEQLGGNS